MWGCAPPMRVDGDQMLRYESAIRSPPNDAAREISKSLRVECAHAGNLNVFDGAFDATRSGERRKPAVLVRQHAADSLPECSLGDRVGEAFRAYLNGERPMQRTVDVTLSLLREDDLNKADLRQLITMPGTQRKRPHWSHEFALCGMWFAVHTGASRTEVEYSLTGTVPLLGLVARSLYLEWVRVLFEGAKFVGRKPPLGTTGVRAS